MAQSNMWDIRNRPKNKEWKELLDKILACFPKDHPDPYIIDQNDIINLINTDPAIRGK